MVWRVHDVRAQHSHGVESLSVVRLASRGVGMEGHEWGKDLSDFQLFHRTNTRKDQRKSWRDYYTCYCGVR